MPEETLGVLGYRELLRACTRAERDSRKEVRAALASVGEVVRREWASRFGRISERSASGYRVRVRQRGIAVEQSLRKTTGLRPDYGALQQRFGLRVLSDKEAEVELAAEAALGRIKQTFER